MRDARNLQVRLLVRFTSHCFNGRYFSNLRFKRTRFISSQLQFLLAHVFQVHVLLVQFILLQSSTVRVIHSAVITQ